MPHHEISESQPILPGFEEPTPTEIPADAAPARFADPSWDTEDATDRWLEEVGGGPRRKTLAVDPPPAPKPIKQPNRFWCRPYNEGSDSELDPDWNVPVPRLTDEQIAINRQGATRMRRAMAAYHARRLAEKADNDPRRALALSRAEAERRQKHI